MLADCIGADELCYSINVSFNENVEHFNHTVAQSDTYKSFHDTDIIVDRHLDMVDQIISQQDILINNGCELRNDSVAVSCSVSSDPARHDLEDSCDDLKLFRSNNVNRLLIGALNINSLRKKFDAFKFILTEGFMDIFSISESKIDDSFPVSQFSVKGFYVYRQDSTATSGGIITWIRNDIPNNRRIDIEVQNIFLQSICVEVHIRKEKWFILSVYRLPDSCVNNFIENLCTMVDKCQRESNMVIIIGDMNIDLSKSNPKAEKLCEMMNLHNLVNKINEPTCFKGSVPSQIDLCIVSQPRRFGSVLNWNCGLSDWHNVIAIATKLKIPKPRNTVIKYRSFKKFNLEDYQRDISFIPFQVMDIFDDIDDKYWFFNCLVSEVVNDHTPIKTRYVKGKGAPHMNRDLRRLMYKKRMSQNAYWKCKGNSILWENYRKLRNRFVKMNRLCRQEYFRERCKQGSSDQNFWQTIKPYFSDKVSQLNDIMLMEGQNVVSDNCDVANVFNEYYRYITDHIGFTDTCSDISVEELICKYNDHESIKLIRDLNKGDTCALNTLTEKQVYDILSRVNPKKATGFDELPPKLLYLARNELAPSITNIINYGIVNAKFPSYLKLAEITPCFKKDNPMDKTKYRPVSILPCISKIMESAIDCQLSKYFYDKKAGCLSAYRKMYNTQSVLVKAIEDWRYALDNGKYCAAILMDLSKAFDVIPHGLLIAKLSAYGFSLDCVKLIQNYLNDRFQRVKVKQARSNWSVIKKGVPQGSVLGPTLFNIFINDMLFCVSGVELYNYADDNTIACISESPHELVIKMEQCGNKITEWFITNGMQANPDKYQAIAFGNKNDAPQCFAIRGQNIKCNDNVKLLGIEIDCKLSFDKHVSHLCKRASKQINAIMRLSKVLDLDVKMSIFLSFIKSIFSYCPLTWMFTKHSNIRKLERLQHRALRFVYSDFDASYTDLLQRNNTMSVTSYLKYMLSIEVYKCVNNLSPDYLCELFENKSIKYDMRDNNKIIQRKFKSISYGYNSFKYYGAKVWNELPTDVKCCTTLREFKRKCQTFLGHSI